MPVAKIIFGLALAMVSGTFIATFPPALVGCLVGGAFIGNGLYYLTSR